jgi:hypothetical protein
LDLLPKFGEGINEKIDERVFVDCACKGHSPLCPYMPKTYMDASMPKTYMDASMPKTYMDTSIQLSNNGELYVRFTAAMSKIFEKPITESMVCASIIANLNKCEEITDFDEFNFEALYGLNVMNIEQYRLMLVIIMVIVVKGSVSIRRWDDMKAVVRNLSFRTLYRNFLEELVAFAEYAMRKERDRVRKLKFAIFLSTTNSKIMIDNVGIKSLDYKDRLMLTYLQMTKDNVAFGLVNFDRIVRDTIPREIIKKIVLKQEVNELIICSGFIKAKFVRRRIESDKFEFYTVLIE